MRALRLVAFVAIGVGGFIGGVVLDELQWQRLKQKRRASGAETRRSLNASQEASVGRS